MIDTFQDHLIFPTVQSQARHAGLIQALWILGIVALAGLMGFYLLLFENNGSIIAWILFIAGMGLILYQPRYGLYLIVFLTLVGDVFLSPWFPFVKNLSSPESNKIARFHRISDLESLLLRLTTFLAVSLLE